jgi:hypothetical protein
MRRGPLPAGIGGHRLIAASMVSRRAELTAPTTSGERRTVALRTRGCGRPFRSAKEAVVFCKLVAVVPGAAGTA